MEMEGHTLARMRSVDMAAMSHVGSCRTLAPAVAASRRVALTSPLSTPQTQTQTTGKIVHNDRRAHLQFVPPASVHEYMPGLIITQEKTSFPRDRRCTRLV